MGNSGGGVIVIGVDSAGNTVGIDSAISKKMDPAVIGDKIRKYTAGNDPRCSVRIETRGSGTVLALAIDASITPVAFEKAGTYEVGAKPKCAFNAGSFYFRHNTRSEPGTTEDVAAATLKRLSEQAVAYDVSKFEPLLPPQFRGYLIRSSRRLGMEGLRQRHCVAAYHSQVEAQFCVIASVFIDRRRWTVQLMLTKDAAKPLRVAQIRTRFNQMPSREVQSAICQELGIPPDMTGSGPEECEQSGGLHMENLRRILPVLRMHNVRTVTVRFDGCGDSGSVDRIDYLDAPLPSTGIEVEIQVNSLSLVGDRWVKNSTLERKDLDTAIEEITQDYLEETNVNWYDNDGGFGTLAIDVAGTVALKVMVRVTDVSREFDAVRDILTGESIDGLSAETPGAPQEPPAVMTRYCGNLGVA